MKRIILVTFAVLVLMASIVRIAGAVANDGSVALAIAGRSNATTSIAADEQLVVVAWSASARGVTDIYAASSADGGRTFGRPVRVNNVAGSANVSGEQPPRVMLVPRRGADRAVVIVWTAKGAAGTRLLTARSEDAGRTFGPAQTLSGGEAAGNRGWESAAVDASGNSVVIWLDHRELAAPAAAPAPMTHDHSAMKMPSHDPASVGKEQLSKLYFQRLDGSGQATALTGGVCYCCKTSIVAGADQTFYAVWRHVYPGNIRDIAFSISRDGGRTFAPPVRVSEDRWMLDGCPENGPALATSGKDVIAVWPTLVAGTKAEEPAMKLFYATTRDGRSFTTRALIPTDGVPRHPQIATLSDGSVVAAWDEAVNGRRRIVLASKRATSAAFVRGAAIADTETAEYPAIAAVGTKTVVAWTSGPPDRAVIRVRRSER